MSIAAPSHPPARRLRAALAATALALLAALTAPAQAVSVTPGGTEQLGGQVNAAGTAVTFRAYAKNATRMEVYLYAQATGAALPEIGYIARV